MNKKYYHFENTSYGCELTKYFDLKLHCTNHNIQDKQAKKIFKELLKESINTLVFAAYEPSGVEYSKHLRDWEEIIQNPAIKTHDRKVVFSSLDEIVKKAGYSEPPNLCFKTNKCVENSQCFFITIESADELYDLIKHVEKSIPGLSLEFYSSLTNDKLFNLDKEEYLKEKQKMNNIKEKIIQKGYLYAKEQLAHTKSQGSIESVYIPFKNIKEQIECLEPEIMLALNELEQCGKVKCFGRHTDQFCFQLCDSFESSFNINIKHVDNSQNLKIDGKDIQVNAVNGSSEGKLENIKKPIVEKNSNHETFTERVTAFIYHVAATIKLFFLGH